MARIAVLADDQQALLLDERDVRPEHVHDQHAAMQLLERLAWAVDESERRFPATRARTLSSV